MISIFNFYYISITISGRLILVTISRRNYLDKVFKLTSVIYFVVVGSFIQQLIAIVKSYSRKL